MIESKTPSPNRLFIEFVELVTHGFCPIPAGESVSSELKLSSQTALIQNPHTYQVATNRELESVLAAWYVPFDCLSILAAEELIS